MVPIWLSLASNLTWQLDNETFNCANISTWIDLVTLWLALVTKRETWYIWSLISYLHIEGRFLRYYLGGNMGKCIVILWVDEPPTLRGVQFSLIITIFSKVNHAFVSCECGIMSWLALDRHVTLISAYHSFIFSFLKQLSLLNQNLQN